jgi:glutamine synthetase
MAKPFTNLSGSGLHVHCSLLDGAGRNVFAPATAERPYGPALENAVGGLLATMPEAMALFAQTANAYRRYKPNAFVPTAPNWGLNNRTTALRIPPSAPADARFEHRVAGADANLYLTVAAILAGVLHGLENQLQPPPPAEGDASLRDPPSLPRTWAEALGACMAGQILPGYLGADYLRLYTRIKQAERSRFEAEVTPLDHAWYRSVL